MVASVLKSSINVKSGNLSPMQFAAKHDMKIGDRRVYSTFYGKATGLSKNTDPKDPDRIVWGLTGVFEVQPSEDMPAVGSARAFIPDAIHNAVAAELARVSKIIVDGKEKKVSASVSFIFEATVVMGGTAGFTWEYNFTNNGVPEEEDELAELRKLMKEKKVTLAAPTAEHKGKVKAA